MDSLCANYASSDEEEQEVPAPQLLKPSAKPLNLKSEAEVNDEEKGFNSNSTSKPGGILNSLPPPKSSLFNSLPPPKSQSFPNPNLQPKIEQRREEQFVEIPKPKSSSSSLFSSLPPPSAPSSSNNSRKVVQFKPPTIQTPYSSKIDDEDDEDDEGEKEKQRKRLKESLSTSSASSFLSSIPAPRYSASLGTLGTGRKSMFETVAQVSTETIINAKESNSVGSADVGSVSIAQNNGGMNSNVVVSEVNPGDTNYDYSAGHGMSVGSGDVDCMYGYGQHVEYSHAGDSYVDYGDNVQYENNWANETALPEVSAVISELQVPGKRGRKDAPLEIVEVKQDELMKNRPRQDQVKSTGIAFGPAYQGLKIEQKTSTGYISSSMASGNKIKNSKFESNDQLELDKDNESPPMAEDEKISAASSPVQEMTTISKHHFGGIEDGFSISIIENMKEEYGLFVWPCSIILAEYVWQQKSLFSGANVVELGAGTSLPGLVAAKVGADVTLTDDSHRSEVMENMRRVSDLNDLNCKVLGLTWGVWDTPIFSLHPNIILGADVLYDTSAFDDLFATVTFLLQKCPNSVFITTYHNRSGHHLIEFLMEKWDLKCAKLLDGFSFMPSQKTSSLSGNIQLAEIVLDAARSE